MILPKKSLMPGRLPAMPFWQGMICLYMGNMRSNTDPDSYTSIIHTLDSFTQKYLEDPTFAARVDESALNILTQKIKQYPSFELIM